ncbi:hypothetical protein GQ54DRAFT_117733 [Martensiomyces pterosporus]|nr:hypothetical protein GQ54DRAFT_117733 [Martensiomyces pterosporus]
MSVFLASTPIVVLVALLFRSPGFVLCFMFPTLKRFSVFIGGRGCQSHTLAAACASARVFFYGGTSDCLLLSNSALPWLALLSSLKLQLAHMFRLIPFVCQYSGFRSRTHALTSQHRRKEERVDNE